MQQPIIAISAGDPAGIGPEIAVKALNLPETYKQCRPLLVCDPPIVEQAIEFCSLKTKISVVDDPADGHYRFGTIDVLRMKQVSMVTFQHNQVGSVTGEASFRYVEKVIELAMSGQAQATVTGPINKEAIHLAGHHYAGHTEIYAEKTNTQHYAMMLADGNFRVIHVSTHVSLREAIERVKQARIIEVIKLAHEALQRLGIERPRIAVNGLNPHAGENGLFGTEDQEEIGPAIRAAQQLGIDADGPHPPDTVFPKLKGGQYDIVVCMYHDQGHIPTKLTGFNYNHATDRWEGMSGVNITLGLPIIRVSVDHGTAFDKGGKNQANPESMIQAIAYATQLANHVTPSHEAR
ncbi:MAG: 4-hydroxythreonine-4-phosphate dehydrogenase PdxA [Tunicatimonas sp.]